MKIIFGPSVSLSLASKTGEPVEQLPQRRVTQRPVQRPEITYLVTTQCERRSA